MSGIKSSGYEVEMMIREEATLMEIEVATNWPADGINALAREIGYGHNVASGRFQKAAKAKPTPVGIVRTSTQTDTGAVVADSGLLTSDPSHDRGTNREHGGEPSLSVPAPVSPTADDEPARELTPPAPVPPSSSVPTVTEAEALTSPPASVTVPERPDITMTITADVEHFPATMAEVGGIVARAFGQVDPAALISAGLAHIDDTIGDLALQAKVSIDRLAAALVAYEQRGEALAEVARLEAERIILDDALLAARRAAGLDIPPVVPAPVTTPAPTKRKPIGVSFTAMREWAQATGRDWGRGRPTNALIAEYQAATQDGAA